MNHTAPEVAAVEKVSLTVEDVQIRDLSGLELALVGGGQGDIVLG